MVESVLAVVGGFAVWIGVSLLLGWGMSRAGRSLNHHVAPPRK